jgi:hypothetical protein
VTFDNVRVLDNEGALAIPDVRRGWVWLALA